MTSQKHEWRKQEKGFYLPKAKPEVVEVPAWKFVTLTGEGNPNCEPFAECIRALYSLAYGIKMTAKKAGCAPAGHYDYAVYPLEGVWDLNEDARKNFTGRINKDDLVFKLMIRQPDFVDQSFFRMILDSVKARNPHALLDEVRFETIKEEKCIQMLHVGPYDEEPASFEKMEKFASEQGLTRLSKIHREIYLSDFRKTAPSRLKTVLRFQAG